MLRLFTYWEDILRERASQDAVAEQTSATENIVPENTIPRNISTDSTITDNTITECTTENSSIENPTEETDEVATTDMNNDGEDTAIKAPGGRNALEVVKHFFFQPLRLPPMPRGLDLTRRAGRNQFSFWILHVVFSVIYWVVMNLYSIYHMLLFLLIIADAFGCEGAGRLLKELTFGWLPIAWLGWARSDEGKAAEQEYTAAHDRVRAEYNEQVRQLRLQREARRMAWTG